MALHYRVYLVGVLVSLLTAAVAAVALGNISNGNAQTATLTQRNAQFNLFSAAQRDITASQLQYTASIALPKGSSERRELFVQASAQQQRGLAEWNRFGRTPGNGIATSTEAAQLDADLRTLPYVSSASLTPPVASAAAGPSSVVTAGTTAPTTRQAPTTLNTTAVQVAVPALRVAADFDAVRQTEDSWWAAQLSAARATGRRGAFAVIVTGSLALIGVILALLLLARAARRRDADLAERDRDLERVAASNEFEARLQRALELSASEDRVYDVVTQALDEMVPQLSVEMLLADSSRAHFQQLVTTGSEPTHRCSVDSPTQCPAAQRGEVLTFESNSALDACPYLKQQSTPCSAVCVPVSVSGLTVGVVHAAGPHDAPPDAQKRTTLELISRRASDRIGMMRAFSDSETQASTDPLTGLPNRRSLENSVRRLKASGTAYAVAFGDLDHFKQVNDKYGHGAGDHALRVFARVLRDQLRPGDIFGRYGGEEFLIVLPDCDEDTAADVLERIRASLSVMLISADCPPFTVSFGLALNSTGQRFEDTVSVADSALLDAKRLGRDRVVMARSDLGEVAGAADDRESVMSR